MLYPLRFEPIFREYIWGGRRLQSELGKPLGDAERYAESWEVVDHGVDQSIVSHGPLAGQALNNLLAAHTTDLMGEQFGGYQRFPLLFKFLDCNRNLSVQVHPNDAQAATLDPPDLGKTEAWIVLAAEPGATIYAGLQPGTDRQMLATAIEQGNTESCLHHFEPEVGDCVFIPAGTVHALGAGLVVAEIQQSSDTTFRLFDWNRVDDQGQSRPLHVEPALEVIDYDRGPVRPRKPQRNLPRQPLVQCDKFVLDRLTLTGESFVGGDARAHLLAVLEGEVEVEGDAGAEPARRGTTLLVPACSGRTRLNPLSSSSVLDIYLPSVGR